MVRWRFNLLNNQGEVTAEQPMDSQGGNRDIAELPGWKVSISVLYLEREWSDVYL